ncbi:hypothetical protein HaLaN_09208, partial [Haematococcus lacustris]
MGLRQRWPGEHTQHFSPAAEANRACQKAYTAGAPDSSLAETQLTRLPKELHPPPWTLPNPFSCFFPGNAGSPLRPPP